MSWISEPLPRPREIEAGRLEARRKSLAGFRLLDTLLRPCVDLLMLSLAQALTVVTISNQLSSARIKWSVGYGILVVLFTAGALGLLGCYRLVVLRRPEQELARICKAFFAMFAVVGAIAFLLPGIPALKHGAIIWIGFALPLVLVGRFVIRTVYSRLWKAGYARRRVILIGTDEGLRDFRQRLAIQRFRGYEIVGLVSNRSEVSGTIPNLDGPVLGNTANWREIIERVEAQTVVIDLDGTAGQSGLMTGILRDCAQRGIEVQLSHNLFREHGGNCEIDQCNGGVHLRSVPLWSIQLQRACKFALDRTIGLIGSVVTLLIAPVIWAVIKTEDGGPLFYRQQFVGPDGNRRYYLKFRSMVQNADQVLQNDPELRRRFAEKHKLEDDPRVLRAGKFLRKFSIDEFPEFFSVLTGNLTFVGPRTISMAEKSRYGSMLETLLTVKPGLTGYWQTMGRQTTTYEERVLMDMYYINHWSIWMDLVIIGKTFCKFFAQDGAY